MSSGINLSGTDLFICFLLAQKSPKFTHHPAHKCIKMLINVLNTQFWQPFYPTNWCQFYSQNAPEFTYWHQKIKNFLGEAPYTHLSGRGGSPSPGSDLRPLQQGHLLLCQLPLLLFFLVKTLLDPSNSNTVRILWDIHMIFPCSFLTKGEPGFTPVIMKQNQEDFYSGQSSWGNN